MISHLIQEEKEAHRGKQLVQGRTVSEQQSQDLNPAVWPRALPVDTTEIIIWGADWQYVVRATKNIPTLCPVITVLETCSKKVVQKK